MQGLTQGEAATAVQLLRRSGCQKLHTAKQCKPIFRYKSGPKKLKKADSSHPSSRLIIRESPSARLCVTLAGGSKKLGA
jgi:hypothetical protein